MTTAFRARLSTSMDIDVDTDIATDVEQGHG